MTRYFACAALAVLAFTGVLRAETNAELKEQVRKTEIAFAKSMSDRDLAAFATFLTEDSIFMSGGNASRGIKEITAAWKPLFEGARAPFSWEPQYVEVLASGLLALSSGPVRDPSGYRTGTYNSVWRREAGGNWKIVMDSGCPNINCGTPAK